MAKKKFTVKIYYSGFCTYEGIEAEDEGEAIGICREMDIDYDDLHTTLEEWHECDEAFAEGEEESGE